MIYSSAGRYHVFPCPHSVSKHTRCNTIGKKVSGTFSRRHRFLGDLVTGLWGDVLVEYPLRVGPGTLDPSRDDNVDHDLAGPPEKLRAGVVIPDPPLSCPVGAPPGPP